MNKTNQYEAIVIASYGNQCKIENKSNELLTAKSLKSVGKPLCGDNIKYKIEPNNELVITEILPRTTVLSRLNNLNPKPKQIAANIDQMIIVVSAEDNLKFGLIDRYLVAAEFSDFHPVIALNKTDKISKGNVSELNKSMQVYTNLDIPVFYTSAKNKSGIDKLLSITKDKTNIVVGQSGVGKSSIVNAILPDKPALTKEISDSTNKGKHTTTTAFLYSIPDNGKLIDSPGIREFGLWNVTKEELAKGFVEIREHGKQCKFRDCLHRNEPGCTVIKAVNEKEITQQRYGSYLAIFNSLS